MPRLRMNGKEFEIPDSSDWTAGELSEAEHAIGAAFGNGSKGDDIAIMAYIGARREDKETHSALLGDAAKAVKFGDLLDDEDPPADASEKEADPEEQPIFGISRSESMA